MSRDKCAFDQRRFAVLEGLRQGITDKSPKGSIDAPVFDLVSYINSQDDIYTTSSCSGRVTLFRDGSADKGGTWLVAEHSYATESQIFDALRPYLNSTDAALLPAPAVPSSEPAAIPEQSVSGDNADADSDANADDMEGNIHLRYEGFILAIEARTLEAASHFLTLAHQCGYRDSGITAVAKRYIVNVRGALRVDAPVVLAGRLVVNCAYVRSVLALANAKQRRNFAKIDAFTDALKAVSHLFSSRSAAAAAKSNSDSGNASENARAATEPATPAAIAAVTAPLAVAVPRRLTKFYKDSLKARGWLALDRPAANASAASGANTASFSALTGEAVAAAIDAGSALTAVTEIASFLAQTADDASASASATATAASGVPGAIAPVAVSSEPWSVLPLTPAGSIALALARSVALPHTALSSASVTAAAASVSAALAVDAALAVSAPAGPSAGYTAALAAAAAALAAAVSTSGCTPVKPAAKFEPKDKDGAHARVTAAALAALGANAAADAGAIVATAVVLPVSALTATAAPVPAAAPASATATAAASSAATAAVATAAGGGTSSPLTRLTSALSALLSRHGLAPHDALYKAAMRALPPHRWEVLGRTSLLPLANTNAPNSVTGDEDAVAGAHVALLPASSPIGAVGGLWELLTTGAVAERAADRAAPETADAAAGGAGAVAIKKPENVAAGETSYFAPLPSQQQQQNKKQPSRAAAAAADSAELPPVPSSFAPLAADTVYGLIAAALRVAALARQAPVAGDLVRSSAARLLWTQGGAAGPVAAAARAAAAEDDDIYAAAPADAVAAGVSAGAAAEACVPAPAAEGFARDTCWVLHKENGIVYALDVLRSMFSSGNTTEKARAAAMPAPLAAADAAAAAAALPLAKASAPTAPTAAFASPFAGASAAALTAALGARETMVDLYAGVGYFTLPYVVRARAEHVFACELNPPSVVALRRALRRNTTDSIDNSAAAVAPASSRVTVVPGDNRRAAVRWLVRESADRVSLGLIPSSEDGWLAALAALRTRGGMLHVHMNVPRGGGRAWARNTLLPALRALLDSDVARETAEQQGVVFDSVAVPAAHGAANSKSSGDSAAVVLPRGLTVHPAAGAVLASPALALSSLRAPAPAAPLLSAGKREWALEVTHVEVVKSYAPQVEHVVVDIAAFSPDAKDAAELPPAVVKALAAAALAANVAATAAANTPAVTVAATTALAVAKSGSGSRATAAATPVATGSNALPVIPASLPQSPSLPLSALVRSDCGAALTPSSSLLARAQTPGTREHGIASAMATVAAAAEPIPVPPVFADVPASDCAAARASVARELPVVTGCTATEFAALVLPVSAPVILRGLDVGPCVARWADDAYLTRATQGVQLPVHVANTPLMNMQPRNYSFRTVGMAELLAAGKASSEGSSEGAAAAAEYMYLRSVGADARKSVADIAETFPELARDITVPAFVPEAAAFSSVLRVSSPGLQLWPHFDVADNFLVHVRGRKRVTLWAPAHAGALGIAAAPDASSAPFTRLPSAAESDADSALPARYLQSAHARRIEGVLEPGDVLFLPAFWLHHVETLPGDVGVSVNVFWRHLLPEVYAGKDVYGNKDVVAGAVVLVHAQKAVAAMAALPVGVYREFYALRGIEALCAAMGGSRDKAGVAADKSSE